MSQPRTARSTIVAVTSSRLACSSTRVPTWPGPDAVGRDELDRARSTPAEQRPRLLLARRVAHRGVDRRAGEPAVAARVASRAQSTRAEPERRARPPASADRERRDRERVGERAPALVEDRLRVGGSIGARRHRDDGRDAGDRRELRLGEPRRCVRHDARVAPQRGSRARGPAKHATSRDRRRCPDRDDGAGRSARPTGGRSRPSRARRGRRTSRGAPAHRVVDRVACARPVIVRSGSPMRRWRYGPSLRCLHGRSASTRSAVTLHVADAVPAVVRRAS